MINVYCKNMGWLFQDLAQEIVDAGAVYSDRPLKGADAYICIRTNEAVLSPVPSKTVVQVHDMSSYDLGGYGMISCVHQSQASAISANIPHFVLPIGTRPIPEATTRNDTMVIGWFAREVQRGRIQLKRSNMFLEAVKIAKRTIGFDALCVGQKLNHMKSHCIVDNRAAVPTDYDRVDALVVTSASPMIPISAYEALAAGVQVISTKRNWPMTVPVVEANSAEEIANAIVGVYNDRKRIEPVVPFTRTDWAKRQVAEARKLIL